MRFRFDVTTLESLERDFMAAKAVMDEWDWIHGGYLSLYLSNKNRLLKEKEVRDKEFLKNNKSKK